MYVCMYAYTWSWKRRNFFYSFAKLSAVIDFMPEVAHKQLGGDIRSYILVSSLRRFWLAI